MTVDWRDKIAEKFAIRQTANEVNFDRNLLAQSTFRFIHSVVDGSRRKCSSVLGELRKTTEARTLYLGDQNANAEL